MKTINWSYVLRKAVAYSILTLTLLAVVSSLAVVFTLPELYIVRTLIVAVVLFSTFIVAFWWSAYEVTKPKDKQS